MGFPETNIVRIQYFLLVSHLEKHFHPVDEEEDDHDKHEDRVTTVKDVRVEMPVLMADPNQEELGDE